MRAAYEGQKTGALICETEEAKRLVFFESGQLVGAKSDLVRDRLGEVLVREKRITAEQLEEVTGFIRSGHRLGQILVELDYLRGGEIEKFVWVQILDIAGAILLSTPERLVFSEQVPIQAITLSPVSIGDVFLHAVKRLPDVDIYRENVLIDDYVLAQTSDALGIAPGMELSEDEAFVLDLVDSSNSVGEILQKSPLGDERTVRVLIALHQSGIVELRDKKASERPAPGPRPTPQAAAAADPFEKELASVYSEMQCQNHWQVLGLSRGAGYSDVERAHKELSAKFDPAKYEHIPDGDFQEKLSSVYARLKEAFVTLSSQTSTNVYDQLVERESQYQETQKKWEVVVAEPQQPEDWDRERDPEEAARLFKRAQRCFKERDFWRAIELCRTSIELDQENYPDRFHLLGRALSENPRWRLDAEKNLKIAIKLEPWETRYLVSLGQLYEKAGMTARAQRAYDEVKVMDPDFEIPEVKVADGKAGEESKRVG